MIRAQKQPARAPGIARRVTMAEVAAAAEVSVPTVSKVLNGRSDVAVETRQRVEAVIHTSGYARKVRTWPARAREPSLVDLVFSEFGPYATELIRGAEETALRNQCRIAVSALSCGSKEARWLHSVRTRGSDGVVLAFAELTPQHRERLKTLKVPVVVVDPVGHPDLSTPSVGVTNWAGGMMATQHLLDLGHRRIGLIAGRMTKLCNQARLDGYRAALGRAGIDIDPALMSTGAHHHPSALTAALAMLDLADCPTAIFATNDIHAVGVYEAARRHGLRLPDDLSVVGFDDIPMAEWVSPPLTTVRQPLAEMAGLAIQMLLRKEAVDLCHRVELATSLTVRSSTAPPRRRS